MTNFETPKMTSALDVLHDQAEADRDWNPVPAEYQETGIEYIFEELDFYAAEAAQDEAERERMFYAF